MFYSARNLPRVPWKVPCPKFEFSRVCIPGFSHENFHRQICYETILWFLPMIDTPSRNSLLLESWVPPVIQASFAYRPPFYYFTKNAYLPNSCLETPHLQTFIRVQFMLHRKLSERSKLSKVSMPKFPSLVVLIGQNLLRNDPKIARFAGVSRSSVQILKACSKDLQPKHLRCWVAKTSKNQSAYSELIECHHFIYPDFIHLWPKVIC